jgi:hypothetical protein
VPAQIVVAVALIFTETGMFGFTVMATGALVTGLGEGHNAEEVTVTVT